MLDGSAATKPLNTAQCSSPEVMTMAEDPESDNESFGSDTDTVILPQTQTATPDDRPLSETESFDAVSFTGSVSSLWETAETTQLLR